MKTNSPSRRKALKNGQRNQPAKPSKTTVASIQAAVGKGQCYISPETRKQLIALQRSCKLDEELQEQLAGAATPPPAPETPPAILALPPIPGVLELPRPTESDLADLPCAVGMVHHQLSLWFSLSINEQVLRFFGEAGCWYEQFRHHPSFRAEASALRSLLEGERRLSALLTPIRQP